MTVLDGYDIACLVGQAFEQLGVEYFLGGSMASSLQGPPRKLDWYRKGDEANAQQFRDVVGVLQFQGAALNQRYLDVWAPKVGVVDLLARARAAASR